MDKQNGIPMAFPPETDFIDFYWWKYNTVKYNEWGHSIVADPEKVNKFIDDNFTKISGDRQTNENDIFYIKRYVGSHKLIYDKKIFIDYNCNPDLNRYTFHIYWLNDEHYDEIVRGFVETILLMAVKEESKTKLYMIVSREGDIDLQPFEINVPEMDISLNYGPDWEAKHSYLLEVLRGETKKGLVLLHGEPGTGKSMYIRYLCSMLANERPVVYIPNQLIGSLTDPNFLPLMAENPNCLLILEDAEEILKARKSGGFTVDKLLNLTDGIISDFLGVQILCTFNSDVSLIDEALLRKGRLILKHEFKKLNITDAQKVVDHLKLNFSVDKEMTLAEIYNHEVKFNDIVTKNPSKKLGF